MTTVALEEDAKAAGATPMMRGGGYARVSKPSQAEQGYSLEAQESILADWAEKKYPGGQLGLYVDRGRSAWKDAGKHRPEFDRLCNDIRARRLDYVVAVHSDRLARSAITSLELKRLCLEFGVELWITSSGRVDTTPAGDFTFTMIAALAQLQSANKSEAIRNSQSAQRAKGLPTSGGTPTFGLRRNPTTRALEPDENAPYVRQAFDRFLLNPNVAELGRWLLEIRGPGASRKQNSALSFARGLLRNRHYLGEIKAGPRWMPGAHEALVDAETFDHVGAILDNNAATHARPAPIDYWAGLIRHECGRRMAYNTSKECTYRRCPVCKGWSQVRAALVDKALVCTVDGFLVELAIALEDPSFAETPSPNAKEIARLELEHARATEACRRLSLALADPDQPEMEIRDQLREAKQGRDRIVAQLEHARGTGQTLRERLAALLPTVDRFDYGAQDDDFRPPLREPEPYDQDEQQHWFSRSDSSARAAAAKQIIDSVTVYDAGYLEVKIKHAGTFTAPLGADETSRRGLRGLESTFAFGVGSVTVLPWSASSRSACPAP